jgi:hypothetical protein
VSGDDSAVALVPTLSSARPLHSHSDVSPNQLETKKIKKKNKVKNQKMKDNSNQKESQIPI